MKEKSLIDENGKIMHIINDTPVSIRVNVFTNQMYVLRYGKSILSRWSEIEEKIIKYRE